MGPSPPVSQSSVRKDPIHEGEKQT
ncbi:hypothetical protein CGRA01v4_06744 [Colletotrichum graminicola]|nr:hypothetical protein CGRA01v4_06744 [Colletotrichum graminicola]